MNSYEVEKIVLAQVLKFGKEAAGLLLPALTPDKFIFSIEGEFGADHTVIWDGIREVFLNNKEVPTLFTVLNILGDDYREYLVQLVNSLSESYLIETLDPKVLLRYGELVHKQGIVYNVSVHARAIGNNLVSLEMFNCKVNSIDDINTWVNGEILTLREDSDVEMKGYTHISTVVDEVLEDWDRQRKGEQLVLLPVGMPSLMMAHLFPIGKMAVVHGLSGSGKSAFVHQVNLGTAIGLVANHIQGCVAINSLEMSQKDLTERLLSTLAHVNVSKFVDGKITELEFQSLVDWAEFVKRLPIYIDDTNFLTTSAMEYRATGLHISDKGPVLQLSSDYGELFRNEDEASEEQRINHVFREQFFLSRSIGASVIAISQSTTGDKSTSKSYIAGPDGTRYSRAVLQAADLLMEVWNPIAMQTAGRVFTVPDNLSGTNPWIIIQKYRKNGRPCVIPLGWTPETTTFFDLGFQQNIGQEIIFDHIDAALEAMNLGARILPIEDSPLNDIGW